MRIFVVDDDQAALERLSRNLRALGHDVKVASDPVLAVKEFDDSVDALITALRMCSMSGVELARAVLARHAHLPIAFFTEHSAADSLAEQASRLGVVFTKSWTRFDCELIVDTLRRRQFGSRREQKRTRPSCPNDAPES